MALDVSAYLTRLDYSGSLEPTLETLQALQRAHLFSVPFENLDIGLGRSIRLEEEALFDKIITRRRGGFCYELNGLFARLLEQLGYRVDLLNARGVNDDGSYSLEFDHLALAVTCPKEPGIPYLVDVGWGNGPLEPLLLENEHEQRQEERVFQLLEEHGYSILAERVEREDGSRAWIRHYAFQRQPHAYADFIDTCRYHQTSPESIFTQKRLCTLYLPEGRVTLSNHRLIITRGGQREERELRNEGEVRQVLKDWFSVEL